MKYNINNYIFTTHRVLPGGGNLRKLSRKIVKIATSFAVLALLLTPIFSIFPAADDVANAAETAKVGDYEFAGSFPIVAQTVSDGSILAMDADGNLWTYDQAGQKILQISQTGEIVKTVELKISPEQVGFNCNVERLCAPNENSYSYARSLVISRGAAYIGGSGMLAKFDLATGAATLLTSEVELCADDNDANSCGMWRYDSSADSGAIAMDAAGNIYFAGNLRLQTQLGDGCQAIKFDANLTPQKCVGAYNDSNYARNLQIGANGNMYVDDNVNNDNSTYLSRITDNGLISAVKMSLDTPAGTLQGFSSAPSNTQPFALDAAGNFYLSAVGTSIDNGNGAYFGDPSPYGIIKLNPDGTFNNVVAAGDPNNADPTAVWSQNSGDQSAQYGSSIVVTPDGATVYITDNSAGEVKIYSRVAECEWNPQITAKDPACVEPEKPTEPIVLTPPNTGRM